MRLKINKIMFENISLDQNEIITDYVYVDCMVPCTVRSRLPVINRE